MKKIVLFLSIIGIASCLASPYKIGKPYQIDGRWYYPHKNARYNEVGIASWYGAETEVHKRPTSLGEKFDKGKISGAHKTLPLPSVVNVTNLENGKSLKIRINDRGPFVDGRIIDLSEKAAEILGYKEKGIARVRVQFDQKETQKILGNKHCI